MQPITEAWQREQRLALDEIEVLVAGALAALHLVAYLLAKVL